MRNIEKAIYCFRESSNLRCSEAKNNLGVILKNGEGIKQDICKAIELFNEAIKHSNDLFSLINLARIYYFGIGIEQNIDKSVELLKKAMQYDYLASNQFLFMIIIEHEIKDGFNVDLINSNLKNRLLFDKMFLLHSFDEDIFQKMFIFFKQYDFFYLFDELSFLSDLNYFLKTGICHKINDNDDSNPRSGKKIPDINNVFYEGFNM